MTPAVRNGGTTSSPPTGTEDGLAAAGAEVEEPEPCVEGYEAVFSLVVPFVALVPDNRSDESRVLIIRSEACGAEDPPRIFVDGREPVWSREESKLFVRRGGSLIAVSLHLEEDVDETRVVSSEEETVYPGPYTPSATAAANYDLFPDGRVVIIRPEDASVRVVLNWRPD